MPTNRRARLPTILVVDDKRANLLALDGLLSSEYNVVFANTGEEALEIFRKLPGVDVVLLDVQMPGMDGFEVAAAIKKMPGGAEVPIIFITAVFNEDPWVRR